ncbi:hypothetical protein, partial [Paenibacillus endoradicis]
EQLEQAQQESQKLIEALELISTRTMSQFMNGSMMAGNMRDIAISTLQEVQHGTSIEVGESSE